VAGDELIGLLRRLNEDSDCALILAEHRLERCLPAADRVIAMAGGAVAFDGPPGEFLHWAATAAPELQTPGSRLLEELGLPAAAGVRGARSRLRSAGLLPDPAPTGDVGNSSAHSDGQDSPRPRKASPVLELGGVWHELRDGPAILRAASLSIAPGERVALMGRNGAGKSTLVRHLAGLSAPTRGRIEAAGRVALLLQNPNDYLLHETVADEASAEALAQVGLQALGERHPRDLSGGERQRLALAIVLDGGEPPAAVLLDEPTRGMDRAAKGELAARLRALDAAVLVATHDAEFAAALAQRVVLLADGRAIADGPVDEVLSGGWYFATETARIVGALTPEAGAEAIRARLTMEPAP
jgi:energy-coupling factor transport system ATP-binding protein